MQNDSLGNTGASQHTDDGTDLRSRASEAIGTVRERAGEQLESRITEQKTRAADTLSGVAQSLLLSSQNVREQGQADVGRYIERAADQVDRLANYLQRADVHDMADRVEDFARRSPGAFVAGAFAVGFLASRFLKSSRDQLGYQPGRPSGIDDTRAGYESGSNFDYGRSSYDTSRPRMENWRTSGYAASESPNRSRDVIGDPGTRTSSERSR